MIPLWNVEELEAVLPDDCRVERKSARIDVRRGRVTTRIMDRLTGGDGVPVFAPHILYGHRPHRPT